MASSAIVSPPAKPSKKSAILLATSDVVCRSSSSPEFAQSQRCTSLPLAKSRRSPSSLAKADALIARYGRDENLGWTASRESRVSTNFGDGEGLWFFIRIERCAKAAVGELFEALGTFP